MVLSKSAEAVQSQAVSFHSNVLIIGGAYAGLSALVALKNHLRERDRLQKVSVTLVEPRAGLLNILGIPRAIVDTDFAATQYVPFEELDDITFDRVISQDPVVIESLGKTAQPGNNDYIEITYVQGKVLDLHEHTATYYLNKDHAITGTIEFNYVVVATGRDRQWPTSPVAHNIDDYLLEMKEINEHLEGCSRIGVIGAGAVGVEIAGDIKSHYPDKEVILIHPHEKFPAEPLPEDFKDLTRDSLERSGVKIMTGYRVKKELKTHLLTFTNGETLQTDFNYWCNNFRNNTNLFHADFDEFITDDNNVHVNEYLQLYQPETEELCPHMFVIGDLVEFAIIKSAGWALYMGRQVANNIVSLIFDNKLVEQMPDLTQMPKGMVLVAGNNELVSSLDGVLELNNEHYVEEYKDYCIGKIRVTLGA